MAKRIFPARDRANTTGNPISKPTLTYTDALPRSDLRNLGEVNPSRPDPKRSNTAPVPEWPQRKSSKETRANHTFDFQISLEPQPYVQSPVERRDNRQEDEMIGIALGSPSAHKALQFCGNAEFSSNERAETPSVVTDDDPPVVEQKLSKWKKIGGLFKAKASFQQTPPPFYQVKINDQQLRHEPEGPKSPVALLQYASLHQSPPRSDGASNNQHLHGVGVAIDEPPKSYRLRSDSAQPRATGSPGEGKNPSLKRQTEDNELPSSSPTPHLTLDIPDIQMERYSVMFGNLLGKDSSSNLLARRSKTLEKLKTCDEDVLSPKEPSLSEFPLPRRATSPSLTTPTFNIFPATPVSKASKVLGTHSIPRGPAPLQRAKTAPVSPSKAFFGHDTTKGAPPAIHENSSLATSSTSRTQSAAGGSLISVSSTDSLTSQDSNTILLQLKPCAIAPGKEPAWEMVKPEGNPKPKAVKSASPKLSKPRSEELLNNKAMNPSPRKKISTPAIAVTTHHSPQKNTEKKLPPPPPPAREPPAATNRVLPRSTSLKPNISIGNPPPAPAPSPPRPTNLKPNTSADRPPPAATAPPPRSTSLSRNIPAVKPPPSPTPGPPRTTSLKPHNRDPASHRQRPQHEPPKSKSLPRKKHESERVEDDTNKVVISVARSVSLSRRVKHTLVPIGLRTDTLQPTERPVEKRVGTPTSLAMQKGHRYEKSQEVTIETA